MEMCFPGLLKGLWWAGFILTLISKADVKHLLLWQSRKFRRRNRLTLPIYLHNRLKIPLFCGFDLIALQLCLSPNPGMKMRSPLLTDNHCLWESVRWMVTETFPRWVLSSRFVSINVNTLSPIHTMVHKRILTLKKVSFSKSSFQCCIGQKAMKPIYSILMVTCATSWHSTVSQLISHTNHPELTYTPQIKGRVPNKAAPPQTPAANFRVLRPPRLLTNCLQIREFLWPPQLW